MHTVIALHLLETHYAFLHSKKEGKTGTCIMTLPCAVSIMDTFIDAPHTSS